MLTINLKTKFTSINYEEVIEQYYYKSYNENTVHFDLQKLEWIAIEQFTFLLSWINDLADKGVYVIIHFQSDLDIASNSTTYKNRKRCINTIVSKWCFLLKLSQDVKCQYHGIKYDLTINPETYCELPIIEYKSETFDLTFESLFYANIDFFEDSLKVIDDNNLKYASNKHLLYSFIKEFYSNACQHAYEDIIKQKVFFSVKYDSKINNPSQIQNNLELRYSERSIDERNLFKSNDNKYINQSYVEFNLMDFGCGITKSLRNKYELILNDDKENIKKSLISHSSDCDIDTKILEYAFMLFTSRYSLEEDLELHEYIPRGLFIIKDLVKRYGGIIIARSNNGKIIFNYLKSNNAQEVIICNENKIRFPGTSITIILPSIQKEIVHSTNTEVPFLDSNRILKNVPLLKYLSNIKLDSLKITSSNEQAKKKFIISTFFTRLCKSLIDHNNSDENSKFLICFDFSGISGYRYDIIDKLIYFISHCPLITQKCSCLIYCITDYQILKKYSDGYSIIPEARPIPCLFPNNEIRWLGIDFTSPLQKQLTDLWRSNVKYFYTEEDIRVIEGNVIRITFNNKYRIEIVMDDYSKIITYLNACIKKAIENEINNMGIEFNELHSSDEDGTNHNYNNILLEGLYRNNKKEEKRRAYLTSNGKYQLVFLSFIEKLYIREYRNMIATYLLFKLVNIEGQNIDKISKILTVTLSSQLIGQEITEILDLLNLKATLVPLSSYFDFQYEDYFEEIEEGDEVLLVNDVVSTGNLTHRLIENLIEKKIKKSIPISIVDCRTPAEISNFKIPIISLSNYIIEKSNINPFESQKPIWINPILNAPTTMSRAKAFKNNILFEPQAFLKLFKDDSYFKIGLFKRNTVLHTYFLSTHKIMEDIFSKKLDLFKFIVPELKNKILADKKITKREKYLEIEQLIQNLRNSNLEKEDLKVLDSSYGNIKDIIENYSQLTENIDKVEIDFIFYPFLSSASKINTNKDIFIKYLSKSPNLTEIYPLPRIMTPKGWRFTFPPKFLNSHTKQKVALIFDDGSCTGETITQAIDALSFLELKEIIVFSLFVRLEDFQREYFSRVNQIKVKDKHNDYKNIPVTIYFGTHFHIPVYTKNLHPFHSDENEIKRIRNYYARKKQILPEYLVRYINWREKKIDNENSNINEFDFLNIVDKKLMFAIRDKIGIFEGYRLFKEDGFEDEIVSTDSLELLTSNSEGKLALVSVIVHEPILVETLRRISPELLQLGLSFIIEEFNSEIKILNDDKKLFFYLRALSILNKNYFLNPENLYLIFSNESISHYENHEYSLSISYIAYIFHSQIINKNSIFIDKDIVKTYHTFLSIFSRFMLDFQTLNRNYSIIRGIANDLEIFKKKLIVDNESLNHFFELRNFYLKSQKNYKHSYLFDEFGELYSDLIGFNTESRSFEEFKKLILDFVENNNEDIILETAEHMKECLLFLSDFYKEFNHSDKFYSREYCLSIKDGLITVEQFIESFILLKDFHRFESQFQNENLHRIAYGFREFRDNFLDINMPFAHYIINPSTDVKPSIQSYIIKIFKNQPSNICTDKIIEMKIEMQKYFYDFIIKGIIINKYTYAYHDKAEFISEELGEIVLLTYHQYSSLRSGAKNSFTKMEEIASFYGGKFEIKKIETDNIKNSEFKILISIPKS